MNVIKGLITKDFLQLKSYRRTLIIFIVIFILTGISQNNTEGLEGENLLSLMLAVGFGMFSMATFSYDEQAKADKYILTLPLTKKEIVLSKYILVTMSTIIGAALGTIMSLIISYIFNQQLPDINALISLALGSILGIGLVESIKIPCIYKFGVERGRIQVFIATIIIALLVGGIFYIGEKVGTDLPINNILNILNTYLPIILIVAIVVMYYISYKVAYKIYSKKEM